MISKRSAWSNEAAVTVAVNDYWGPRAHVGNILPAQLRKNTNPADYTRNHAHMASCGLHVVTCEIDRRATRAKTAHKTCPTLAARTRPACVTCK